MLTAPPLFFINRLFLNISLPKWTILGQFTVSNQQAETSASTIKFIHSKLLLCRAKSLEHNFAPCTCFLPVFRVVLTGLFWKTEDHGYLNQHKIGISTSDGFGFKAATTAGFLATELWGGLDWGGGWSWEVGLVEVGCWWLPDVL